jgi:2-polyprenyl-3-methyl-5-hydroxy-6-metoxy-1,4-benzoquinol methylase
MRTPSDREYIHERLGDQFRTALSVYDTKRRMETLIDEFLPDNVLRGKSVLEVGTGLGYFAERMIERGALVTVVDLGGTLVYNVAQRLGCPGYRADALSLTEVFKPSTFDIVLSSECIEHTPDPSRAVAQMMTVLKPGGLLSLSTPNLLWLPVVRAATIFGLRPFDGLENFSTFGGLRSTLSQQGATVLRETGLHLFPFQLRMLKLSTWFDEHCQFARKAMINICILAQKRASADTGRG